MILAIEIISLCILFTLATVVGTLRDPLGDMKNMPIPLQEYILSLPEYAHLKDFHVVRTKERLVKKIPALILVLVIFALMIRYAGATNFVTGFGYTLLLWVVLKLYVTLVLTCGWYAHTKAAWVKGTEDKKELYQDYRFYLSSIPRSLLVGVVLATVIGGICMIW